MKTASTSNAKDLEREFDWFARIIATRFALYFKRECDYHHIGELKPSELTHSKSNYAALQALEKGDNVITLEVPQRGIWREQAKEGKAG